MTTDQPPLQIDIVSDVVCPWCVIGYRQLAAALAASGTPHDLRWHPFELNPDMPPEGQNLRQHLTEKYGSTPAQSEQNRRHLAAAAEGVGFDMRFSDDMRMHNTFNVHQLLHWADTQGQGPALHQAMFGAHFTHHRDLSDPAVLADIAASVGLDRAEALAVIADQRFAADVRQAEKFWIEQGIRSVPAVIFNGRHLVSGAQGVENFTRMLEQLAAMPTESTA